VIYNILSNEIKFSKPEGSVAITARKEGCMAQVSVSDTGIGIKEEDIRKLFKEFEQIDRGTSRLYGGTGLGLVISKKLIELHGGRIWVESKYGQGSTFSFTLPYKAIK
jgi:signal transduction histidine kinase